MGLQVILVFYFVLVSIFWVFCSKHVLLSYEKDSLKSSDFCILKSKLRQNFTEFPQLHWLLCPSHSLQSICLQCRRQGNGPSEPAAWGMGSPLCCQSLAQTLSACVLSWMGTQSKVPSLVIHTLGVGSNCSVNVKFSQWLLLTLLV